MAVLKFFRFDFIWLFDMPLNLVEVWSGFLLPAGVVVGWVGITADTFYFRTLIEVP